MSVSQPLRSWRDCRVFVADLEEHAARSARGEGVPHADACEACAARLQAVVIQIALLNRLPRPGIPEQLRSPEFLAGIYERAGRAAEEIVGPALSRVLTRESAPTDADWSATENAAEVADSLARSLPSGRPPGWLWMRIQTEVRGLIESRRRNRRMRRIQVIGLLAASLVISALALWSFLPERQPLTAADIRFLTLSSPPPLGGYLDVVPALRQVGEER